MKILFLHGWRSVPGGVKPTYLAEHGCLVMNPKLDDDDFKAAVLTAQREFDLYRPDCVVGSSRGGAVAMNLNSGATPLVLLCPAWKNWGTVKKLKANSAILHSRQDEVIPFEDSEELLVRSKLPMELLIEVGYEHRLADESSLAAMLWSCQELVSKPTLTDDALAAQTKQWNHHGENMLGESSYICDACGEEIVIPLDLTEGSSQKYVEDCPVCCRANIIHVSIDEDGDAQVWAEPEQDHD
jgi:Cysteine-rich CPXCG